MKKHDEGYVLVYVTVVLILFSLIGSMILTSAMKNLNAQQAAITQMQDKYVAAGAIEKVLVHGLSDSKEPVKDDTNEALIGYKDSIKDANGNVLGYIFVYNDNRIVARCGKVEITCIPKQGGGYEKYEIGEAPTK